MEIFGIGPMELILILIVALMVFGPDKLPQIGAKLGRAMREMRKATRAISDEINNTRAAVENPARELAEPFKDVADAAKAAGTFAAAARNPGQALRDSVIRELNAPPKAEPTGDQATGEENKIAPPQLAARSEIEAVANGSATAADPVPVLPEPEEPVAAMPTAEEPAAQLPAEEAPAVPSSLPEEPLTAPPALTEPVAQLPEPQDACRRAALTRRKRSGAAV